MSEDTQAVGGYDVVTVVGNNCEIHSKTADDYYNLIADIGNMVIESFAEELKLTRVEHNTVFQGIFSPMLCRKSSQCVSIACGFLLALTKIYP